MGKLDEEHETGQGWIWNFACLCKEFRLYPAGDEASIKGLPAEEGKEQIFRRICIYYFP